MNAQEPMISEIKETQEEKDKKESEDKALEE
jgi:hypothetical protein